MKPIKSRFFLLSSLACLTAVLATSLSAQRRDEPVTRDNNKPPELTPPPAPVIDATGTPPPPAGSYNPDRPIDRDNKPVQPLRITRSPLADEGEPNYATDTAAATRSPQSPPDHRLMRKITVSNDYDIALAHQAVGRATHEEVRAFAEMMVADHERMEIEFMGLSQRLGVVTPSGERQFEDEVNDLAAKTGADYDKAFLEETVYAHEEAIELFEKASKSRETDLAAFAVRYLPGLREHLAQARRLQTLFP